MSRPITSHLAFTAAVPRLREVTSLASHVEDLGVDGGLEVLTRSFAEQVAAETALLVVCDGDSPLAPVRAAWGLNSDTHGVAVRRGEGTAGRLLESGRAGTHQLNSPGDDPIGDAKNGRPILATIGAPVRSANGVAGALCAGLSRRPRAERGQLVWAAQSYAAVSSLCLEGSGLLGALVEAARRDPLTGCLNYGALREAIGREVGRADRHDRPLACCFIDLDDFKLVNDTRGHVEGNRALTSVAAALKTAVRGADVVGRYGGDEFVVVLPDTNPRAALALALRLRTEIANATQAETGHAISASVGIGSWSPGCQADELLDRADQALRIAKKAGGKVIAAPDPRSASRWRSREEDSVLRPPRGSRLLLAVRRRMRGA